MILYNVMCYTACYHGYPMISRVIYYHIPPQREVYYSFLIIIVLDMNRLTYTEAINYNEITKL